MRVVLVGSRHADRRNMEHLVFRIAEILASEHEIHVLGCSTVSARIADAYPHQSWEGVTVGRVARMVFRDPVSMRVVRLLAIGAEYRPDVFVALGSIGINGLAVAIASRISGIPAIVRLTSDVFQVFRSKRTPTQKARMFIRNNVLGRLAVRLANKVLLLNAAQRREMEKVGVDNERMAVVPQPIIFPSASSDSQRDIRNELHIPPTARIVLCTMRLDPDKKIDLLIDVIARVQKYSPHPEIHFLIIGEGESRNDLEWAVQRLQAPVHLLPEQPRDELALYYRASDVYIHLSKSEGLSNCLAEALYFGLPVIATDSGTITREMISNIANDSAAIAEMIIHGPIRRDELPDELLPDINAAAWRKVVRDSARHTSGG